MTVATETQRVSYAGDGSTTSFPVTFLFYSNDVITAILRATDGTETTWTENTQYTLTGAGNPNGGTLTVSTSPTDYTPASGTTLVIRREEPLTQQTDLPADGAFPSEAVERQFDRAVMIAQQLNELIGRSLTLPATSGFSGLSLPEPTANQLLGWNSSATDLENKAAVDIDLTTVSTFIQGLLDDGTAGEARGTLDVPGLSADNAFTGANTFTKTQSWAKGADVASAATLTLGDGNYFDVTGTNTVTAIATKGVGTVVKLHFDGALTLIHNATDLILPVGANITTAAGDEAEFVEYATGDWRCTNYQRAAAEQVPAYLVQGSALSGSSVTTIGSGIPSWASRVVIMLSNASTNGTVIPEVRIGDSGGIETSGYSSTGAVIPSGTPPVTSANSAGFKPAGSWAAAIQAAGSIVLDRVSADGRVWVCSTTLGRTDGGANQTFTGGGVKTLSAALDRVAFVTNDTFDGGSWSVRYE